MQELAPTSPRVGLVLQYLQERPTPQIWGKKPQKVTHLVKLTTLKPSCIFSPLLYIHSSSSSSLFVVLNTVAVMHGACTMPNKENERVNTLISLSIHSASWKEHSGGGCGNVSCAYLAGYVAQLYGYSFDMHVSRQLVEHFSWPS